MDQTQQINKSTESVTEIVPGRLQVRRKKQGSRYECTDGIKIKVHVLMERSLWMDDKRLINIAGYAWTNPNILFTTFIENGAWICYNVQYREGDLSQGSCFPQRNPSILCDIPHTMESSSGHHNSGSVSHIPFRKPYTTVLYLGLSKKFSVLPVQRYDKDIVQPTTWSWQVCSPGPQSMDNNKSKCG